MTITEWVEFLYNVILKRPPDPEGLAYYVQELEITGDLRDVIGSMIRSPEYNALMQSFDEEKADLDLIELLYRALLDRPADPSGLANSLTRLKNLSGNPRAIIQDLTHSQEYQNLEAGRNSFKAEGAIFRFGLSPPNNIDWEISPHETDRLLCSTAETWQSLGDQEPHWSVLTSNKFRQDRLDETEFYATGATDLCLLEAFFKRAACDLGTVQKVLEVGCGVGRVTEHLARRFASVEALDVSSAHLIVAERRLNELGVQNAKFHRIRTVGALKHFPIVDLVYSVIVLQHNPPPVIRMMLEGMLERVALHGYAYFQLPTYKADYSFAIEEYRSTPNEMEMHALPQRVVFQILDRFGYRLLEVQEDTWVGDYDRFLSNTFFAERRVISRSQQ